MGKDSEIGWTHHTFNPWWGCTKISPGCKNCYAAAFDKRVGGKHWGPDAPSRFFGDKHWLEPLRWNAEAVRAGERHRVFCASMADVCEELPGERGAELDRERARLWLMIGQTPHLDWLILTKRPERFHAVLPSDWGDGYPNVWLGATAEDQQRQDERWEHLAHVPAAVRFLSCEPLLSELDLSLQIERYENCRRCGASYPVDDAVLLSPSRVPADRCSVCAHKGCMITTWGSSQRAALERGEFEDLGPALHWVIVGGESGAGYRPCDPAWIASIVAQCTEAGVSVFVKQDSGARARRQGRIPDEIWARKEFPEVR
jgi:protein gp37